MLMKYGKISWFYPFYHLVFHWFFKYLHMSVIIVPCKLMRFMGDWEWDLFKHDCWEGFDQTTVMQPKATGTAGMMQLAEDKTVKPNYCNKICLNG